VVNDLRDVSFRNQHDSDLVTFHRVNNFWSLALNLHLDT